MPGTFRSKFDQRLKFSRWWTYKIGAGVFTLLLYKYLLPVYGPLSISASELILFVVLLLLAVFGHFVNDYSDFDSDREAGKPNIFNFISFGLSLPLILALGAAVLALVFCFLPRVVFYLSILQIFCSILYSVRPSRLKERGIAAAFLTGFYERALPYLIIVCTIVPMSDLPHSILLFTCVYLAWAYAWEFRNFLNGQHSDLENDAKSGTLSLAVSYGAEKMARLKQFVLNAEIVLLLCWLALLVCMEPLLAVFVLLALLIPVIHWATHQKSGIFRNSEHFISYFSNYGLLAGLVCFLLASRKIDWFPAVLLLLVFSSRYPRTSFLFVWGLLVKAYYACRYVASQIVNHVIYYFRRYILQWSDAKSRGKKDEI